MSCLPPAFVSELCLRIKERHKVEPDPPYTGPPPTVYIRTDAPCQSTYLNHQILQEQLRDSFYRSPDISYCSPAPVESVYSPAPTNSKCPGTPSTVGGGCYGGGPPACVTTHGGVSTCSSLDQSQGIPILQQNLAAAHAQLSQSSQSSSEYHPCSSCPSSDYTYSLCSSHTDATVGGSCPPAIDCSRCKPCKPKDPTPSNSDSSSSDPSSSDPKPNGTDNDPENNEAGLQQCIDGCYEKFGTNPTDTIPGMEGEYPQGDDQGEQGEDPDVSDPTPTGGSGDCNKRCESIKKMMEESGCPGTVTCNLDGGEWEGGGVEDGGWSTGVIPTETGAFEAGGVTREEDEYTDQTVSEDNSSGANPTCEEKCENLRKECPNVVSCKRDQPSMTSGCSAPCGGGKRFCSGTFTMECSSII